VSIIPAKVFADQLVLITHFIKAASQPHFSSLCPSACQVPRSGARGLGSSAFCPLLLWRRALGWDWGPRLRAGAMLPVTGVLLEGSPALAEGTNLEKPIGTGN